MSNLNFDISFNLLVNVQGSQPLTSEPIFIRPVVHPFAESIKYLNSLYQEDHFDFVTSMYKCYYVSTVLPFYVYYLNYVYNNTYDRMDKNNEGFINVPLYHSTHDPEYLEMRSFYNWP